MVQTQVLIEMPVPNMAKRLIFSTSRLGRFLISQSGMGLLVCVAMVTLASHLWGQRQDGGHEEGDTQQYPVMGLRCAGNTSGGHGALCSAPSPAEREVLGCHQRPPRPPVPTLSHSQDVFPEAALPLRLVEEVVEVAAKSDEDEAKGQEAENAWKKSGTSLV